MSKTLFFIHGTWLGGWCWDKYADYFSAKGYRCVAPTLPYHDVDPTEPPPPEVGVCTLATYVDFLEDEVNKHDEPPVIIGHSLGGFLAQSLAARGFGKAVVLIAPAAPAGVFALKWSTIKVFSENLLQWGFWRKPLKKPSYERMVYGAYHQTPEEEIKEIYKKMVADSGRAIVELAFWLFDSNKAAYVDEKNVKIPMLVLAGGEDRLVPASVVKKVAAKYPQAVYKEYPSSAHHLLGQPGWEEVAAYILGWIAINEAGEGNLDSEG